MEQKSQWRVKGIRAALGSAFFLGLIPVFAKQAIRYGFSPLSVAALRTGIAAALLLMIMLIFRRKFLYIYPVGLIGCLLAGVVNGFGSIFYYLGLGRVDASIGHLIYSLYPFFVALWHFSDRQPLSHLTLVRLILAIPAVVLLSYSTDRTIDLTGILFMLASAIFYGLHLIINQRVLYEVPAPTVTMYTLLAMSAVVIPAYLVFDHSLPSILVPIWPIFGLGVITFLSRLTLFFGVKFLGGVETAILGLGEMIITISLALIWLGERLSLNQWIGVILLAVSLFLVIREKQSSTKRIQGGWLGWISPPEIHRDMLP